MFKSNLELREHSLSIDEMEKIFYPAYVQKEQYFGKYLESRMGKGSVPKYPKKLPGSIWAITSFFNPAKYSNKYENYKKFRESSKRQGLNLITIELSFDGEDSFDIQEEDTDILIRVNGGEKNIMWQKEALLNIALKHLPDDCDKLIWVDCDVIFHNDNWLNDTAKLLEEYNVIQPFSAMISLPKGVARSEELEDLKWGLGERRIVHSLARGISYLGKEKLLGYNYFICGTIGYAWSIRREILDEVNGFFDSMVLGGADSIMAYAFYGYDWRGLKDSVPLQVLQKSEEWVDAVRDRTKASVFYTQGIIDHLWHGNRHNRNYANRWKVLADFDPDRDIYKIPNGIYQWSEGSDRLRAECENYFHSRKEECAES